MGLPGVSLWEKFGTWVGTGFGLGLVAPVAPGTVGSLPGVLLAWGLASAVRDWRVQVLIALGLAVAAIPFCGVAERVLKKKDDGRICADEWLLYPLGVIGLPLTEAWWLIPVSFVVIRVCDIIKPPPARQLQSIQGGVGIVIDDFFANIYALAINWGVWLLACRVLSEG